MVQRVIGDKIINNRTRGLENNPPLSGAGTTAGFVIKTKPLLYNKTPSRQRSGIRMDDDCSRFFRHVVSGVSRQVFDH